MTSVADLDLAVSTILAAVFGGGAKMQDVIYHSIDFNRKRQLLKSISGLGDATEPFGEVLSLLDVADKLMGRRHVVAHGMLIPDGDDMIIPSMSAPNLIKTVKSKALPLHISELSALSDQADEVATRLFDLANFFEASRK